MGENLSRSGLKSKGFSWECHERVKNTLLQSITFDKSEGVLLQNKIVDQQLSQKNSFQLGVSRKNKTNTALEPNL